MKVYFYDRESGVYQGEGFETNSHAIGEEGITITVPPPYGPGFVPVFNGETGWLLQACHRSGAPGTSRRAAGTSVMPKP